MQRPVGREHAGRAEPDLCSVEIREAPARLAHEHGERSDVENVDVRLDDHIERAARQQVVVQKITVTAQTIDAADQRAKSRPSRAGGRQGLEISSREERGQAGERARLFRFPAEIAAASSDVTVLTRMGRSLRKAPAPSSAQASSPKAGALETPSTSLPARISAI